MHDSIDIATVARLTGLTSRALRFYEARGLVKPLRSASGRRYYGPGELRKPRNCAKPARCSPPYCPASSVASPSMLRPFAR